MVTRTKAKPTIVGGTEHTQEPLFSEQTFYSAGSPEYLFHMTKRELVGVVCGILTSGALGYAAGWIASAVAAGLLITTTSVFLAWMGFWLTAICGWLVAIAAAARVQRKICDGSLDRDLAEAKNAVVGWFNDSVSYVSAKFA